LNCATKAEDNILNYQKNKELFQYLDIGEEVIYTYDVIFKESDIKWATRWDHYLHSDNSKIHWVSLMNSNIIVLVFTSLVAHLFCRALKKDIDYINSVKL
jgi:transmembrane 9 superfamily protein 2/4